MDSLLTAGLIFDRLAVTVAFLFILCVPAWSLAGRLQEGSAPAFFRFLIAIGLALVGYLSSVM